MNLEQSLSELRVQGYCVLRLGELSSRGGYDIFCSSYDELETDPHPGRRQRTHLRCTFTLKDGSLSPVTSDPRDGRLSKFKRVSSTVTESDFFNHLVQHDVHFASEAGFFPDHESLSIGIHQIRYLPQGDLPAFSKPVWLHKDGVPLVFIHLVAQSAGLIGGTNVVSKELDSVDRIVALTKPLDTLVMSENVYHAVMPMAAPNEVERCWRDVLLITVEAA